VEAAGACGTHPYFSESSAKREQEYDELIQELYRQIGKLQVERDWLKKDWDH